MPEEPKELPIFMPSQAATATGGDGSRKLFLYVPQLSKEIQRVKAERPGEFTYQWGYHSRQNMHVLLCGWPGGVVFGVALPEAEMGPLLDYLTGFCDIYITAMPLVGRFAEETPTAVVDEYIMGDTVGLTGVMFRRPGEALPGPAETPDPDEW